MVTAVAAVNRQKCKVFLEEDFAFVLYKSEAERFHIKEGQPLSGEAYQQIEQEILLPRARNKALDLLTVQARSRQQLRAKLAREGYPEPVVSQVMDFLDEYRFVDDGVYAENYLNYKSTGKSRRQLKEELRLKGVESEAIEQAFYQVEIDEEAGALALVKKRLKGRDRMTYEEKCKHSAYLSRKGYSYDTIHHVMAKFEVSGDDYL